MGQGRAWLAEYDIVESFIIILVFNSMIIFEAVFEYKGYSCPEYCGVEHEHIEELNELQSIIRYSKSNARKHEVARPARDGGGRAGRAEQIKCGRYWRRSFRYVH